MDVPKKEPRFFGNRRYVLTLRGFAPAVLLALACAAGTVRAQTNNLEQAQKKGNYVGDPVLANSGAYCFSIPLFDLGGPFPLTYGLNYQTDWEAEFKLESGFRSSINSQLERRPNGVEIILDKETLVFEADGTDWVIRSDFDTRYVLKETGASPTIGCYYLMDPIRERVYTFEKAGGTFVISYARLLRVEDRNGNHHDYTYTGGNRYPDRVEDGLGRSLDFTYSGFLERVTDQGGRHIDIAYDYNAADFNNGIVLRSVTDASGATSTFHYAYVATQPFTKPIVRLVRPLGNAPYTQTVEDWPLNGESAVRVTSQADAYGNTLGVNYTAAGNQVTVTRPDAGTVVFEHYHNGGVPKSVTDVTGKTANYGQTVNEQTSEVVDRMGGTNNIAYHVQTGRIASFRDAEGHTTTYTYTPQGQSFSNAVYAETVSFTFYNLTRIDYPDGTFEEFAHDARGNVVARQDRAGKTGTFAYNARGQVALHLNAAGGTNIYTYLADGNRLTSEDPELGVTTYHYDGFKRLDRLTYPDSNTVELTYDLNDRLVAYTDERDNQTTFTYDANGNLVRITDPKGNTTEYTYDLMDRVTSITDRRGKTATRTYNNMNRLESETDPNGIAVGYAYDARADVGSEIWRTGVTVGGQTWRTAYDDEGVPVSCTTPVGRTTTYETDQRGVTAALADPLGSRTALTRDAMGRTTAAMDPLGRVTTFAHNGWDSLDSVAMPVVGAATYRRNDLGKLTRITDPNGRHWRFTYGPMGRMETAVDPLANTWTYTYDGRGRIRRTAYPDGVTATRTYDEAGNLLQWAAGGLVLDYTYDAELDRLTAAEDIGLTYDEAGNITGTDNHGTLYGAAYDNGGRLTNVTYGPLTATYTYDDVTGLLTAVEDSITGTRIGFTYDADRRPVHITRPNGVDTTYSYDDVGRLTRIRHGVLGNLHYTFDAVGQVARVHGNVPLSAASLLRTASNSLAYDAANQVSAASYAYDDRGRRTADPGRAAVSWYARDRVTGIGGVTMTYNGLDDIVTRTEGGVTIGYYYNYAIVAQPVMAERNETTGTLLRYYIYTPDGRLLYMIDDVGPTTARFYHFDSGGSTLFLTDGVGAVTDAYAYSPYGRLLRHDGSNTQPMTFMGQWGVRHESQGTLYHCRARYYDAQMAGFLSRDPVWPETGDARRLNPYGYALANPISFRDPMGTEPAVAAPSVAGISARLRTGDATAYQDAVDHQVREQGYLNFSYSGPYGWGPFADAVREYHRVTIKKIIARLRSGDKRAYQDAIDYQVQERGYFNFSYSGPNGWGPFADAVKEYKAATVNQINSRLRAGDPTAYKDAVSYLLEEQGYLDYSHSGSHGWGPFSDAIKEYRR